MFPCCTQLGKEEKQNQNIKFVCESEIRFRARYPRWLVERPLERHREKAANHHVKTWLPMVAPLVYSALLRRFYSVRQPHKSPLPVQIIISCTLSFYFASNLVCMYLCSSSLFVSSCMSTFLDRRGIKPGSLGQPQMTRPLFWADLFRF